MNFESKRKDYIIAVVAAIAAVLLDQWSKFLAVHHLKNQASFILVDHVFELHYLENHGAAFGVLQNQRFFFLIIGLVILGAAVWIYHMLPAARHYLPLRICIIAICAGAVGNMIDRIRLGYVVDFFYFSLIDFPIFNVADIYVTVATFLLIVLILFYYQEGEFEEIFHRRK